MAKKFFDILPPKSAKVKEKKTTLVYQEKRSKVPGLKLGLILIILISIGIFSHFYLSKAEVEIWPETENVNFKTEVKITQKIKEIEPSLWFEQKSIPGEFLEEEKELSKEFPSSGIIEKKEFAQGKIRVHNKSKKAITLIKNTRFLSDEGKQFHSLKAITIPAKGYLDGVEVESDGPGEEYNIGPSKFSVPKLAGTSLYAMIYGESLEPMKGGFLGKAPQITEDDLKNAERILLEKLFSEGKETLKKGIGEDYILLDELLNQELIEKFPLAKAGQKLKSFIFKAKIKSTGFIFKKTDLESFSREFIYSQLEGNPEGEPSVPYGASKKLVEKSLNLNYSVKEKDLEKGQIILSLEISGKTYSDPDFQILKEKIKGESAIEGEYFLEKENEISRAKIKLWPFWVKKVPKNNEKIEMRLKVD